MIRPDPRLAAALALQIIASATPWTRVRSWSSRLWLSIALPATNFRVEPVERMSFDAAFTDVVISSAVLHFARDDEQFEAMAHEMWRVLAPRGMLFARLASSIGIEHDIRPIRGRRFHLPNGSERYLVDAPLLADLTRRLGGALLDPLKTTVVQDQRAMTTWVVRKAAT